MILFVPFSLTPHRTISQGQYSTTATSSAQKTPDVVMVPTSPRQVPDSDVVMVPTTGTSSPRQTPEPRSFCSTFTGPTTFTYTQTPTRPLPSTTTPTLDAIRRIKKSHAGGASRRTRLIGVSVEVRAFIHDLKSDPDVLLGRTHTTSPSRGSCRCRRRARATRRPTHAINGRSHRQSCGSSASQCPREQGRTASCQALSSAEKGGRRAGSAREAN